MRMIRFSDTADGGSRFEEVELTFPQSYTDEFGNVYQLTKPFIPANAILADLPHGLDQDWHVAPNRQVVIVLTGVLEVETTDGETRRWSAGGMFMADDPRGKGHRTRVIEGPAKLLFMRVPDDFRVQEWIR
jgi:hypothetical protein